MDVGSDVERGPSYTVDELAARAGVTVRTVRFYGTRGSFRRPSSGPGGSGTTGRSTSPGSPSSRSSSGRA